MIILKTHKPNSSLSSGHTRQNLTGTMQLETLVKDDHILVFVYSLLMRLQCKELKEDHCIYLL